MQRLFKVFFITCAFVVSVAAQPVSNQAPTRWERYRVDEQNVSALFPRLPVLLADRQKSCFGELTMQYNAYTDDSVYALRVTSKVKPDDYCPRKRKFSEKNFEERLKEIRADEAGKEVPAGDKATAKFVGKNWAYVLFNDSKNNRWFELQVVSRDLTKPAINNFLESMKIGQPAEGTAIGEGATGNYGDPNETVKTNLGDGDGYGEAGKTNSRAGVVKTPNDADEPLVIVYKARASYTESARRDNVQGVVRLKVTFLANGGIGSITPVNALTHGLTEQALAAARRLFFLPARRNKVKYSVTKIVEYSFALY
jgi:TonB family protein